MNNKPKVSLLTPCYNGESHLDYFFKSLLEQTYENIEFIIVDDGSTDNTKEIYLKYEKQLQNKGWSTHYLYQHNQGQAAAINNGLKLLTGKYLIFPDSDDILYPNHIEEKVKYMEENPDLGIAYCILDVCTVDDLTTKTGELKCIPDNKMFNNIINKNEKILWPPIGNIIRLSALFDVLPDKEIAICQGGQNCQIQMPLFYKYKCGFIDKALGMYVMRSNSHSNTMAKQLLNKCLTFANIWICSINSLKFATKNEKNRLKTKIIIRTIKEIFNVLVQSIFSIKNEFIDNRKRKVLRIFFLRIVL